MLQVSQDKRQVPYHPVLDKQYRNRSIDEYDKALCKKMLIFSRVSSVRDFLMCFAMGKSSDVFLADALVT